MNNRTGAKQSLFVWFIFVIGVFSFSVAAANTFTVDGKDSLYWFIGKQHVLTMTGVPLQTVEITEGSNPFIKLSCDASASSPYCVVVAGGAEIQVDSGTQFNNGIWTIKLTIPWTASSWAPFSLYSLTDFSDSFTFTNQLKVQALVVAADADVSYYNGTYWFKGGIGYFENGLVISGNVIYDTLSTQLSIHPPAGSIIANLYWDNQKADISDATDIEGDFAFYSGYLPIAATGISINFPVKVVLGNLGNGVHGIGNETVNPFYVNIDNQAPVLNQEHVILEPDLTDNGNDGIVPNIGWYDQPTVSVQMDHLGSAIDDGVGMADTYYVFNEILADKSQSVALTIPEGVSRTITVKVMDRVGNYIATTVNVNVDMTAPNVFSVALRPDTDNLFAPYQVTPDAGWYNDDTIDFEWVTPLDAIGRLRAMPYQVKSDYESVTYCAKAGSVFTEGAFQATTNVTGLRTSSQGINPIKLFVRAIDEAGNVREAYTTVKVDTQKPVINYVTLLPDTTFKTGNQKPDIGWYNDGTEVQWRWSAVDNGEKASLPYRYRNLNGSKTTTNIGWEFGNVGWTNVETILVPTSEAPTGNYFELWVKDKAGNIVTQTALVYVDETPPLLNYYNITFIPDTQSHPEIPPFFDPTHNNVWYAKPTIDFVLTWNVGVEAGGMASFNVKSDTDIGWISQAISNPTFNGFTVVPRDRSPIIMTALFSDHAGWTVQKNAAVYVDVTPPQLFPLYLIADTDSNSDGIGPELGWYDDRTIDFNWDAPLDSGLLRSLPYQYKIGTGDWQAWQTNLKVENLLVTAGLGITVSVQAVDMAGNSVSNSFVMNIDTVAPIGSFSFIIVTETVQTTRSGITPDAGWYDNNGVTVMIPTYNLNDTGGLREVAAGRYFFKNDLGKINFGEGSVAASATIYTVEGGSTLRYFTAAIADHAGNVIQKNAYSYVDINSPQRFHVTIKPDAGANGFVPQTGWYQRTTVNFQWDAAPDDGMLPDKPYRVRSDSTQWSDWQSQLSYNGLFVSSNGNITQNIYVQARDKAGNASTETVTIKVDAESPFTQLTVLADTLEPIYQVTPFKGNYRHTAIRVTWDAAVDTGQLVDLPYRLKCDAGQTTYSAFQSNLEATVNCTAPGLRTITLFAIDKAGNFREVTATVNVNLSDPTMNLMLGVSNPGRTVPFITTEDSALITLSLIEEVTITPNLAYQSFLQNIISTDGKSLVEVYADPISVPLIRLTNSIFIAHFKFPSIIGNGKIYFIATANDNAGNITTKITGNLYYMMQNGAPPPPTGFSAGDYHTNDPFYTKSRWQVMITFNIDSSVSQYYIQDLSVNQPAPSQPAYSSSLFIPFVPEIHYNFQNDIPETKVVYVWVATSRNIVSLIPASCNIIYDPNPPRVEVQAKFPGDPLPGTSVYVVSKGLYRGRLSVFDSVRLPEQYRDQSLITPNLLIMFPNAGSFVTVDVSSTLRMDNSVAASANNADYHREWFFDYSTLAVLNSGTANVWVWVTDNARNSAKGTALFYIDLDAPVDPTLSITSKLTQRFGYTNSVNVDAHISMSQESGPSYDYYLINESAQTLPDPNDVRQNPWPPASPTVNTTYRLQSNLIEENVVEGSYKVYAWILSGPNINKGPVYQTVIYDKTPPNYSIQVGLYQQASNVSEVVSITLSVTEQLWAAPTMDLWVPIGPGVCESLQTHYIGQTVQGFIYVTTVNMNYSYKDKINRLTFTLEDFAGNQNQQNILYRQTLQITKFTDDIPTNNYVSKGDVDVMLATIQLAPVEKPITLTSVRLRLSGTAQNTDVKGFKFYRDGDNDGKCKPLEYKDPLLNSGQDQMELDGTATLHLAIPEIISRTTNYCVAIDVGAGVVENRTLSIGIASHDSIIVDSLQLVQYPTASMQTGQIIFTGAKSTVVVGESGIVLDVTVNQQERNVVLKAFNVRTDVGSVIWYGLKIYLNGTTCSQNILSNIRIYKDSTYDEIFNPATSYGERGDMMISSGVDNFVGKSEITLNFVNGYQPIETFPSTYFIVGDISRTASENATFNVYIKTGFDFDIDRKNSVADSNFPLYGGNAGSSGYFKVHRFVSTVEAVQATLDNTTVYQGDSKYIVQKYTLTADDSTTFLNWINFELADSSPRATSSDFTAITIYKTSAETTGTSLSTVTRDSLLFSTLTWIDATHFRLTFATPVTINASNYFFLVMDINSNAVVGHKINIVQHFISNTGIGFDEYGQTGIAKQLMSNAIEIIDIKEPSQPVLTGRAFSSLIQGVEVTMDTSTRATNGIGSYTFKLGKSKGAGDVIPVVTTNRLISKSGSAMVNELIFVPAMLDDNTTYYLEAWATSAPTLLDPLAYTGKPGFFSFHTDFSAPHLPNNALQVVQEVGQNGIVHDLTWGDFIENESGIAQFTLEQSTGTQPRWVQIAQITPKSSTVVSDSDRGCTLTQRNSNDSYYYRVKALNLAGKESMYLLSDAGIFATVTTKILSNVSNYPNPFAPRQEFSRITYYLREDAAVELRIYDALGHIVRTLHYPKGDPGHASQGTCNVDWDGKNDTGKVVSKGGYFLIIETPFLSGEDSKVKRFIGVIN